MRGTSGGDRRGRWACASAMLLLGLWLLLAGCGGESGNAPEEETAAPGNGKIAFVSDRDGNLEIYAMNSDGTDQTNLTNNDADDSDPVFSPDGSKIAFQRGSLHNREVYVMNSDGSDQTNLTNDEAGDVYPAFSPDGTQIAFMSDRDGNGGTYVMDADGSNPTRLTDPTDISEWYLRRRVFAFSPDETQIAKAQPNLDGDPRDSEIYVANSDGSDQTNLTNDPAFDSDPTFSPDGTKIAFASNRGIMGGFEIYVMNSDGTDQTRLTNNLFASNTHPVFSPDGAK